jgi:hypothetical protein
MSIRLALSTIFLAAGIAACGGGGGNGTTAAPATKSTIGNTAGAARGTASVFIPARIHPAAMQRAPRWVSPSMQSITIQITRESDHAITFFSAVTTPTAPNCARVTGGTLCQIPFGAPSGVDDVLIYAYDTPDPGVGNQLASYAHNGVTFTAGADNSMTFTLGGIIGQLPQPSSPPVFMKGTPVDYSIAFNPVDFDGNSINGPLDAPACVILVNSGTAAHYTLTSPPASGPGISSVPCVLPPNPNGPPPPTQAGVGILDASKVSTLTVHYDGAPGASALLTLGTQSIDTPIVTTNNVFFVTVPLNATS